MALQPIAQSNQSLQRSEEHVEDLLPGIPDEITLKHITSKLPLKAVSILSRLNRSWRETTIQRHDVYYARVGARSTETLDLHCSPREDRCFKIPALQRLGKNITEGSRSTRQKVSVSPSVRPQGTPADRPQRKLSCEGNLLFERETVVFRDIQRHSYAAYIGHCPSLRASLSYFAIGENESIGRERYTFMQKMLYIPCSLPPEREEDRFSGPFISGSEP